MKAPVSTSWIKGWQFGEVSSLQSHFYITFTDIDGTTEAEEPNVNGKNIIARICQLEDGSFAVKCLTEDENKKQALISELDYYLVELPKQWTVTECDSREIKEYLLHHCSTAANVYGQCHWHYHRVWMRDFEEDAICQSSLPIERQLKLWQIGLIALLALLFTGQFDNNTAITVMMLTIGLHWLSLKYAYRYFGGQKPFPLSFWWLVTGTFVLYGLLVLSL